MYGLAWGVNQGLFDAKEDLQSIDRGWAALMHAVAKEAGSAGYSRSVTAPTRVSEGDTQFYGAGAFLLAASEVASVMEN